MGCDFVLMLTPLNQHGIKATVSYAKIGSSRKLEGLCMILALRRND